MIKDHNDRQTKLLFYAAIVLFIPAVFLNLDLLTLWADEPTRALVALEMLYSDNFIASTVSGEFYYHKPPLWNWIVALFFKISGSTSEFMVRLPSVLSYIGYTYIIYYYVKKHVEDKRVAIFSAIAFATGGNIMFFSSFQGHIDMLYSLLTFVGFMVVYEEFEKQRWYRLFIISYIITTAGVMLKGIPSLHFQAFTLLAYFIYKKQFKKLFHPAHFVGIGILVVLIGSYLLAYTQYNTLEEYFYQIYWQGAQRTPINEDKGLWDSISHLFMFPLINIQDLAPWSLLIVFLFTKGAFKQIKAHPFILYISLIFVVNIWVYWLSPGTFPRYIFPLFPLLLTVIVYLYFKQKDNHPKIAKGLYHVFGVLTILVVAAIIVPAFIDDTQLVNHLYIKIAVLAIAATFVSILYYKQPKNHLIILTLSILIARIGFNWFVMVPRHETSRLKDDKAHAYKAAEITKGEPLYLLDWTPLNHNIAFYLQEKRGDIVGFDRDNVADAGVFYLTTDFYLEGKNQGEDYTEFYTFTTKYLNTQIHLVKFNTTFAIRD